MLSKAINKNIRTSPFKLRPIANVIRGYTADKALSWLKTCANQRVKVVEKTLLSAYANAKDLHSEIGSMEELFIKEIRVDAGPVVSYFKPGAMGRANPQKRRMCHLSIVLDAIKPKSSE